MHLRRRTMRKARVVIAAAAVGALTMGLGACGSASAKGGGGSKTVSIAYEKFGNFTQADDLFKGVKAEFEKQNPGCTLKLIPIEASENDYYTKLALMNRSPKTAPDLMYEDTSLIKSDVAAGYLQPLDKYLSSWSDWSKFVPSAKAAGKGDDGKTYGVPMGTDTRGIWYNKDVFAKAGLPTNWQPKTWNDILTAAKTIKAKVPGVTPLYVPSGKPGGEASVMQGFEQLLYGTQGGTLYNDKSQKWVIGSKQFTDALSFIKDVYTTGLGPTAQQALDPNFGTTVDNEWFPKDKLGMAFDGSWVAGTWLSSGSLPWPQWSKVLGVAKMPTQYGQAPGFTSMSGGWTIAMGKDSKNPDLAFKAIEIALNKENSLKYDVAASQVAVRTDVGSDPKYTAANPTVPFFTDLVKVTHFRPATSDYTQISNAIQVAMESVMTGQQSPQQAAATYDKAVIGIVGKDKTTTKA